MRLSIFRKPTYTLLVCFIFTTVFLYYLQCRTNILNTQANTKAPGHNIVHSVYYENAYNIIVVPGRIVLTYIVCDDDEGTEGPARVRETLTSIKSAVIFTQTPIHIILLCTETLKSKFDLVLRRWQYLTHNLFEYDLITIITQKPNDKMWMYLNKKCAGYKLFFPKLFPEIDAMIYLDTDTVFLGPVQELWSYFSLFNGSQIVAMTEEASNITSYYPKENSQPYYGKYGLADSVWLMNLTRMRSFGFTTILPHIVMKWHRDIRYDQDIVNIIFHHYWRSVFVISCRYNFHEDFCKWGDLCPDAVISGVFLLHGSHASFYRNKQPAFMAIFRVIYEYRFREKPVKLILDIDRYLKGAQPSNCGKYEDIFLKVPTVTLKNLYGCLNDC